MTFIIYRKRNAQFIRPFLDLVIDRFYFNLNLSSSIQTKFLTSITQIKKKTKKLMIVFTLKEI